MKNFSLTSLLIATLIFSSCSVEDDPVATLDTSSEALFKAVTVKRDASGAYSLDYQLNDGAGADVISGEKGSKDIYLYSSDNEVQKRFNEDLSFNGNDRLSVGINNTELDRRSTITILEDDIQFDRSSQGDHLKEYKVTDNGDGTYDVDFAVKDDIEAEFVYNETNKFYEIHLTEGSSSQSEFLRTFTKNEGEPLKITFVNHFNAGASKSTKTSSADKPKIIVGNGENGND